jgi:hypothetical protein
MRRKEVWSLTALCAFQLQGTLRVILEPLLVDKPFIGAVTVFFLQKPVSSKPRNRPDTPHEGASYIGI